MGGIVTSAIKRLLKHNACVQIEQGHRDMGHPDIHAGHHTRQRQEPQQNPFAAHLVPGDHFAGVLEKTGTDELRHEVRHCSLMEVRRPCDFRP